MSKKVYLWIEDKKDKAAYVFWKTFMQHMNTDVIVESKRNNSELVKAVKNLSDRESQYIIIYDNSFDNTQVYHERKVLKKYVDSKRNIFMMDIICFEYILLEFNKLIDWIYAPNDEFKIKRTNAIVAREKLTQTLAAGEINYKYLQEIIKYDENVENHNIEQLSAKLLFDLTRNTGFEVSKRKIGECWIKSCCEWLERQDNDICGLDKRHLSVADKMKSIYHGTSLCTKFSNIGLEITL